MPSTLALLLCTGVVVFLLRLERRASGGVSSAVWIPTLWLVAVNSKPLAIWFGQINDNETGSGLDQILLSSLAIGATVVLVQRRFDWVGALRGYQWFFVLLAYMVLSTIWSDMTSVAFRRWVRQLIVVLMALVVMSETDPRQALESVLRRFAYILIPFSLVLIKYYPVWGVSYSYSGISTWIGVTLHKNGFGSVCSISVLFLLWDRYRRWKEGAPAIGRLQKWADFSIIAMALFMLTGAQKNSATVAASLGVGGVTLLWLLVFRRMQPIIRQAVLLIMMISSVGLGLAGPFRVGFNIASLGSDIGRDDTLTGRTIIWKQLMSDFERQPVLGSGFQSFWTTSRRELYDFSDAHNGYLDIMMDLGLVGLVLYWAWLLSYAWKLQHVATSDYYWSSLAISCLLMTMVYNSAESTLNSLGVQTTAVLVLMYFLVPYKSSLESKQVTIQPAVGLERIAGSSFPGDDFALPNVDRFLLLALLF